MVLEASLELGKALLGSSEENRARELEMLFQACCKLVHKDGCPDHAGTVALMYSVRAVKEKKRLEWTRRKGLVVHFGHLVVHGMQQEWRWLNSGPVHQLMTKAAIGGKRNNYKWIP